MARRQPGGKRSKGKKNRKHGRNKESCNLYRQQNRRERNKALRLARHLRHHPTDNTAAAALRGLPMDGALTPSPYPLPGTFLGYTLEGVTYPHEPLGLPCDRSGGALAAPAPRSPGDYPLGGDGVCGGGSGDPTRDSGVWAHTAPGHLLGHRILKFRKQYYNSDWRLPLVGAAPEDGPDSVVVREPAAQAKKDPGEPGPRHEETERLFGYVVPIARIHLAMFTTELGTVQALPGVRVRHRHEADIGIVVGVPPGATTITVVGFSGHHSTL